jgi:hypothetical protein
MDKYLNEIELDLLCLVDDMRDAQESIRPNFELLIADLKLIIDKVCALENVFSNPDSVVTFRNTAKRYLIKNYLADLEFNYSDGLARINSATAGTPFFNTDLEYREYIELIKTEGLA